MEFPNNIQDVYKSIKECNPRKARKDLIVFVNMLTYTISKKFHQAVTELFAGDQKLISFLSFYYTIKLFCTKTCKTKQEIFLYYKIPSKQEVQQFFINISSETDSDKFKKLYRK